MVWLDRLILYVRNAFSVKGSNPSQALAQVAMVCLIWKIIEPSFYSSPLPHREVIMCVCMRDCVLHVCVCVRQSTSRQDPRFDFQQLPAFQLKQYTQASQPYFLVTDLVNLNGNFGVWGGGDGDLNTLYQSYWVSTVSIVYGAMYLTPVHHIVSMFIFD